MNFRSMGVAMITGGGSGIGYELAKLCAKDGYNLLVVGRNTTKLNTVANELASLYNIKVDFVIKDLSESDAADYVFNKLGDQPLDVLINNAGFGVIGSFDTTDWEKEKEMIMLHIVTLTRMTKLAVQRMEFSGKGKILNVASIAGFYPGPLMAVYYATKAYIVSFSEALARELKGTGISVTTLCPGFVKTNFQATAGSRQRLVRQWGILKEPQSVAEKGYRAMMKGKVMVIPGNFSKFIVGLKRIIPRRTMTNIVGALQHANQGPKKPGQPEKPTTPPTEPPTVPSPEQPTPNPHDPPVTIPPEKPAPTPREVPHPPEREG